MFLHHATIISGTTLETASDETATSCSVVPALNLKASSSWAT